MKLFASDLVEITATFSSAKVKLSDGEFCIFIYKYGSDYITAVGSYLPEAPYPVTFSGTWANHPVYGRQFKVDTVVNVLPSTRSDIFSFVMRATGLQKQTVGSMVDSCGGNFWDVLYEQPERLLSIPNVTKESLTLLLKEAKALTVRRDLLRFFRGELPLDKPRYTALYRRFASAPYKLVDSVKADPFLLIRVGYQFKDVDRFAAKHLRCTADDSRRLLGAAYAVLINAQSNAHTGVPFDEMVTEMVKTLRANASVPAEICQQFLYNACKSKTLHYTDGMFYLNRPYVEETALTRKLTAMSHLQPRKIDAKKFSQLISEYEAQKEKKENVADYSLSDDQKNAVWTVLTRQLCVITGGPGTGKSTVLDAVLYCWKRFYTDGDWTLMAPTGKAAVRMTETTHQPASTIHSTLRLTVPEDFGQLASIENEIISSLIVVDESSMLDLTIASSLVGSLAYADSGSQHLVLVGDPDQLPSVGYGNVLADLIDSNAIPVCTLGVVYRQGKKSPIVINARKMQAGDTNLFWGDSEFQGIHQGSDEGNMEAACKRFCNIAHLKGINNVALLSPYRDKTALSTVRFNAALQDKINPLNGRPFVKGPACQFREKDRVMQLKNTTDGEFLSNGDIGTVETVWADAKNDEPCLRVRFETNVTKDYKKEELSQLDLAYAYTIHKSQGSQYFAVIVVLPCEPSPFLTRSILYTAITRAKSYVAIYGPITTVKYMIQNDRKDVRNSRLSQRLRKLSIKGAA